MSDAIRIFDDVLPNPVSYREHALSRAFADVELEGMTFKGIAVATDLTLPYLIQTKYQQGATVLLSFFRQSPLHQPEPNYIHSDAAMGDWTGILYLNPRPPKGDGTIFWRHRVTGRDRGTFDAALQVAFKDWEPIEHVDARFNRLVIFESPLYHSRALRENYGTMGADARLTQVVFLGR